MKRRAVLKAGLGFAASAPLGFIFPATGAAWAADKATNKTTTGRMYAQPSPSFALQLPRDHGVHPEFRTEWWYFTGWFESPAFEESFGVQITFFRSAPNLDIENPSAFSPGQLLFAHAALALPPAGKLKHEQIIRRAGSGGAQIDTKPGEVLNIRMPGWALKTAQGDEWECTIQTPQLGMALRMQQTQQPWLQGKQGFSQKGPLPEQSSHYITLPHMKSSGTIRHNGKTIPVTGSFWMDHEWSSTVLAPDAQGWDWVGLHGTQGEALMAFQIRNKDASQKPIWTHASLRQKNGAVRNFERMEFKTLRKWKSSRTGIEYPVAQQLVLDEQVFNLQPLFDDQELDARASTGTLYWEGAVSVENPGGSSWGKGYLEMTGYDRPMQL